MDISLEWIIFFYKRVFLFGRMRIKIILFYFNLWLRLIIVFY